MHRFMPTFLFLVLLVACSSSPTPRVVPTAPANQLPTPSVPTAQVALRPTQTDQQPTVVATIVPDLNDEEQIAAAQLQARDQVALAEAFRGVDLAEVARTTPLNVQVGDREIFWVADVSGSTNYTITAELRYAGPIVLMYVDTDLEIDQAAIDRSAKAFEEQIYPRNRLFFGTERSPGVDADSRLTVLSTNLRGAGGYFSASDEVPTSVNRFSNQREMFVMGVNSFRMGSDEYAATLAHEFQHMIHQNQLQRSPLWFNEGMSSIAEDVNGFDRDTSTLAYLRNPNLRLVGWSDGTNSFPHYGASRLFLRYFLEQYAGERGTIELIQADAGNQVEAFAEIARRTRPDITNFHTLVADWAVANLINDPAVGDGRYTYRLLPRSATTEDVDPSGATLSTEQFGVRYLELPPGPTMLEFNGESTVSLAAVPPSSGRAMWWSNRGDETVSTLTRPVDLREVQAATLRFRVWHEIESDYDYAFVSASTDNGATWKTLPGRTTTNDDPQGQNFGNGLNGVSGTPDAPPGRGVRGTWLDEEIDLSAFAGQQILLRFWMIQDTGLNYLGLLLDDLSIPEIGWQDDVEADQGDWDAQGFVRVGGELPQRWELRLVRTRDGTTTVEPISVNEVSRATINLAEGETGVLVVVPAALYTDELALFEYRLP
jgi:hypothetical protein